ncbi:UBX domain-containing protein 10 [Bombina bombina]|uniref:UBX domain-containing protein 10 n=1 Tax=Bombina bombina TaxID=8345 RepID=UPI00235A48C4|nr:UBX domain-containing protein 10 [Bombina bombina]
MASMSSGLRVQEHSLHKMHVTRPKSAKGRTRTNPQVFSHTLEAYSCQTSTPPPQISVRRSSVGPRLGQEEIPELLIPEVLPRTRPSSSSLNRYKVLPSIGVSGSVDWTGAEELVRQTSSLNLGTEHHLGQAQRNKVGEISQSHMPGMRLEDSQVHINLKEPSEYEPRLLLAIRAFSGQRFERYFRPSDTLHTVLAAAEEKTGLSCNNCSVESMEVPRRSFPELGWTLQECRIPNKSVLCIHQVEQD